MSLQHYPVQEGFEELVVAHQACIRRTIGEARQARQAQHTGYCPRHWDRCRARYWAAVVLWASAAVALRCRTSSALGLRTDATDGRSHGHRI
jgi:hypothetical protein